MVREFSEEIKQRISDKLKGRIPWNKYITDNPCYSCNSLVTRKNKKRDEWYPNHDKDKNRLCAKCFGCLYPINRPKHQVTREKRIVIDHYSNGKNECKCCGETHLEFLSIDHINGDGANHRKEVKNLYPWLIKNNFPKGFQVLCMNCNVSKGHYKKCPHTDYIDYEQLSEVMGIIK